MLAGIFHSVCYDGMMRADTLNGICVHHKGNIGNNVIGGAFRVTKILSWSHGVIPLVDNQRMPFIAWQ